MGKTRCKKEKKKKKKEGIVNKRGAHKIKMKKIKEIRKNNDNKQ